MSHWTAAPTEAHASQTIAVFGEWGSEQMSERDDEARRVRGALLQLGARDPRLLEMPLQVRGSLSDAQIRERVLLVAFSEFASDRVLSDWWSGEGMPLEHARRLARELGLASDSLDRVIREVLAPRETGSIAANEWALAGSGSSRKATQPSARRTSPNYNAPPATETDDEFLLDSDGAEEGHGSPSNSFAAALGKEVVNFPLFAPAFGAILGLAQSVALIVPAAIETIFGRFWKTPKGSTVAPKSPNFSPNQLEGKTIGTANMRLPQQAPEPSSGPSTVLLSVAGVILRGGPRVVGEVLRVEQSLRVGPAAASFVGPSGTLDGTIQRSTEEVREISVLASNRVFVNIFKHLRSGVDDFGNGPEHWSERHPLDGLKLIGTCMNDCWDFVLESGRPTVEQSKALIEFGKDFCLDQDHCFPEHRVNNGQIWLLTENAFQRYVGRSVESATGRVSMTLKELTRLGDKRFARIEADVEITASGRNELNEHVSMSMRGREKITRDLALFVNVESGFFGNAVVTEHTSFGGQKAKVHYEGPVSNQVRMSRRSYRRSIERT